MSEPNNERRFSLKTIFSKKNNNNDDASYDGMDISIPNLDSLTDFEPVIVNRQVNRRATFCNASPLVMVNVGSTNSLDGRLGGTNFYESSSTIESEVKSLGHVGNVEDKQEAKEINSTKPDPEETQPAPFDVEIKVSEVPSPSTSKNQVSSLQKMRLSPKVLFISICSISMLSIATFLLLYFSIPIGLLENSNLYNEVYFTKNHYQKFSLGNLKDVFMSRNVDKDLPFFWHIPHTVEVDILSNIFGRCYHLSQASSYKEKVYLQDNPFHIVKNGGIDYVNIDLYSITGVDRAIRVGLASSNLCDVVISPHLHLMSNAFTEEHQGRLFVLLRNPIERLLNRYALKLDSSLINFTKIPSEQNYLTRQLSNEHLALTLTSEHLEVAKDVLRHKFLIGKVDEIHESFNRFKMYFGWKSESNSCEEQLFNSTKLKNNVKDLTAEELQVLHDSNSWDMQLYRYAESLFRQQGSRFFGTNKFQ